MFELSHSKSKKLIPSKKLRSLTSLQDISQIKCRFFPGRNHHSTKGKTQSKESGGTWLRSLEEMDQVHQPFWLPKIVPTQPKRIAITYHHPFKVAKKMFFSFRRVFLCRVFLWFLFSRMMPSSRDSKFKKKISGRPWTSPQGRGAAVLPEV